MLGSTETPNFKLHAMGRVAFFLGHAWPNQMA